MVQFWWRPSSWLADSCFLSVSLCGRERTRPKVLRFLFVRVVISSWGYTLMTSPRPNYLPKAPPPSKRICLQYRRPGLDPWVGKIPWRREWQPTPLLQGEFLGQTVGSQRVGHHWATSPFAFFHLDMWISLYEFDGAQTCGVPGTPQLPFPQSLQILVFSASMDILDLLCKGKYTICDLLFWVLSLSVILSHVVCVSTWFHFSVYHLIDI